MQYTIVPSYLNEHKIEFKKLDLIPVNICDVSNAKRYINPYSPPFLIIDLFAKKTTKPPEIVEISLEELKRFGFSIFSMKPRNPWFWGQRKKFSIEPKSSRPVGSKKLGNVPPHHHLGYDKNNRCVRLEGPNTSSKGFTKWREIEK